MKHSRLFLVVALGLAVAGCNGRPSPVPGGPVAQSVLQNAPATVNQNGSEWPEYRRDDQRTGNNPYQTTITTSNVSTLAPKWSVSTGGVFSSAIVAGGVVYGGDRAGNYYARHLSDGSQIWNDSLGGQFISSAYDENGTLYVGLNGGTSSTFYAIDAASGHVNWTYPAPNGSHLTGSPMVENGIVYQGTDAKNEAFNKCDANKQMLALNATSGALVSVLNLAPPNLTGADIWSSPMLDPSGNLYVATGNECTTQQKPFPYANSVLRVVRSKPTMSVKWHFQSLLGPGLDDDMGATPIYVNGMIVEAGKDGYAYALNPATGAMIWHTKIDPTIGSPATDGTRVYIPTIVNNPRCNPGAPCGRFYALNLSDGSIAWSIQVVQNTFHYSEVAAPAVSNGIVFAAFNNAIWALKATDGSTLWKFATPNNVVFGPLTVVNGGLIAGLFGTPGTLYCFTPGGR